MKKVLKFIIDGQTIRKDFQGGCFDGLQKGTEGYLQASFSFRSQWDDLVKIAVFRFNGQEEAARLNSNNTCDIPDAAAACDEFNVAVCGIKKGFRIITQEDTVHL